MLLLCILQQWQYNRIIIFYCYKYYYDTTTSVVTCRRKWRCHCCRHLRRFLLTSLEIVAFCACGPVVKDAIRVPRELGTGTTITVSCNCEAFNRWKICCRKQWPRAISAMVDCRVTPKFRKMMVPRPGQVVALGPIISSPTPRNINDDELELEIIDTDSCCLLSNFHHLQWRDCQELL
jgi:hypothetical protein